MINQLIKYLLKNTFLGYPRSLRKTKDLIVELEPNKTIFLDYPVSLNPRYSKKEPIQKISKIFSTNVEAHKRLLIEFLKLKDNLWSMALDESERKNQNDPIWINRFFPALDTITLYGILASYNPKLFLEVGSGNSTKVAKRSILDNRLQTEIWSIDTQPRTEINQICDKVFRMPMEELDLSVFKQLKAGDILFIDNSHRVFMNSDVTAFFLDVLPILASGVIVQIHDVFLPYDYPESWAERFYSEQYMLAVLLLFGSEKIEILLPNFFVSQDEELSKVLNPIWENTKFDKVERQGASFWFKVI